MKPLRAVLSAAICLAMGGMYCYSQYAYFRLGEEGVRSYASWADQPAVRWLALAALAAAIVLGAVRDAEGAAVRQ